mgnify:CR=1 FL=1
MKIKVPNYLTIGRIIIVPIFVITFYLPGFYGDIIPFVLFVIASFSDFLDGLLARMYKEESKLGELLDPIADKIIVATALILLVMNENIKNYVQHTFSHFKLILNIYEIHTRSKIDIEGEWIKLDDALEQLPSLMKKVANIV